MGVVTFWLLPDYPQTAKFLSADEKEVIIARLAENAPSKTSKTWDTRQALRLFADPTFWSFSMIWFCHAVGGFGLSLVLPTVILELGQCHRKFSLVLLFLTSFTGFTTSALSNALSMPPSMACFLVLNALGWLIQKHNWNPFRVAIGREWLLSTYTV